MEIEKIIDSYKEEIIEELQALLRIKSVEDNPLPGKPFGAGVDDALSYALKLSNKLGLKTSVYDGYAGDAEFGEGDKTVGVLAHLDVVPEGEGWTYPPYGGEIHDGKLYGRGAIDDKGPAIAALYAIKALKESKLPIKSKIRIIFGTDEESGWLGIKHYLKKVKEPDVAFTPDADFPVIYGEKGISIIILSKDFNKASKKDSCIKSIKGGYRANMVPDQCVVELNLDNNHNEAYIRSKVKEFVKHWNYKVELTVDGDLAVVKTFGISVHGSTPEDGVNAISVLMKFLGTLNLPKTDLGDFIRFYNDRIGMEYHGESIGCALEDDVSGKLTFNVGVIDLKEKGVEMKVNIRYPIKSDKETVYAGLRGKIEAIGLNFHEFNHKAPKYISQDHDLVKKLMKVYREETGDYDTQPITIGGGTYARAMDNAVAFGALLPNQEDVAHQKDEYIDLEHLLKITKIYAKALYLLAK